MTALDDLRLQLKQQRAQRRAQEKIDARIEKLYYATCGGVAVNMLDIPKVFDVGRKAIEEFGADDALVALAICKFVSTIRQN